MTYYCLWCPGRGDEAQGPPAMASRAPSSALASICLFQTAPPSPVELLWCGSHLPGGGSYISPLSCVSCVPASCVLIWFVSCPCFLWLSVNSCPAVFVSLSMIILCIYSPVYSVWFGLVYSLLPGVPVCVSLALSCPALFGDIKDCHLSYILVSVFLDPPSCVHRDTCRVTYI